MQARRKYLMDLIDSIHDNHSQPDEMFNFIESFLVLLEDCDSKVFAKAVMQKRFKVGRLTVDISYRGEKL